MEDFHEIKMLQFFFCLIIQSSGIISRCGGAYLEATPVLMDGTAVPLGYKATSSFDAPEDHFSSKFQIMK